MKKLGFAIVASMIGFWTVPALAQDAFKYELLQEHNEKQPAMLRVIALQNLTDVKVSVDHCGAKGIGQTFPKIAAGGNETLSWNQPKGEYDCVINITAKAGLNQPISFRASHKFKSISPLSVEANLSELKPDLNHINLRTTRPVTESSVTVMAEDGSEIDVVEKKFAPTREPKIEWKPNDKLPAVIDIKVGDGKGGPASFTVVYFKIPHTDIVFDTAKSDIRPEQEPHLQDSLDKINDILSKYTKVAVELYITGHTDTVGSAASNDKLSRERAKSIATWFRDHGLNIPTYYRGVGERGLAVATPDETPNEQNRRAVYILSNQAPQENPPLGAWDKL